MTSSSLPDDGEPGVFSFLAVKAKEALHSLIETQVRFKQRNAVPRESDIFIATYPRSGTTWMQMILYQLSTDGGMGFDHIRHVSPWYEMTSLSPREFEALPSARLLKTHLRYEDVPRWPCKYIYVARDGRDVAVSYFHLYKTNFGYKGTFSDFFKSFMAGRVRFGSWFEHVAGYWAHRDDPNVLFLRFEDMKSDLEGSLRRIIAFCGFDVPAERMPTIVERCGFPFMKVHQSKFAPGPATGTSFVREGEKGGWQRILSKEQNEMVLERMAQVGLPLFQ